MKQALEALGNCESMLPEYHQWMSDAQYDLRAAITEAERQEPVAVMWPTNIDGINAFAFTSAAMSEGLKHPGATKLYTTPQPTERHEPVGVVAIHTVRCETATGWREYDIPKIVVNAGKKIKEGDILYTTPQPEYGVVITTDESGRCVAVTRQDEEGHIKKVLWEAPTPQPAIPAWQPIETAPDKQGIDVWVKSKLNPDFGVRVTSVHRIGHKWFGLRTYNDDYYYLSHWTPLPAAPEVPK